jgi:hypothetical protein
VKKHEFILNNLLDAIWAPSHELSWFSVSNLGVESFLNFISFQQYGMKPLSSLGQKYGMALALIETLKICYPEMNNYLFTIGREYNNFDNIFVCFEETDALIETNLKEW